MGGDRTEILGEYPNPRITGEAAGFEERHILQLVLAIGVNTLSNYSNHLFHTPVDPVFARRAWED